MENNIENNIETHKKTRKDYYKTFYEKNKDRIHEKKTCEFCNGSYDYFNKSQHMKSLKCIKARLGEQEYKNRKVNKIMNTLN
ncbi:MAG TPA: hypothetical protein V6C58_23225 [Allocoleopsis sp.]